MHKGSLLALILGGSLVAAVIVATVIVRARRIEKHVGPPTRIVVITLDTLRYDSLMETSERETTMPITRAYAERGLTFTQCYAATSTTQPSHATKFTALHPWQHGVYKNGVVLAEPFTTLAEVLQENGFATSAVVASFPVEKRMGFGQGFDRYHHQFAKGQLSADGRTAHCRGVTNTALKQIDASDSEKQFFWFHFFDPHHPYGSTNAKKQISRPSEILEAALHQRKKPAELLELVQSFRTYYDADVGRLDQFLGQIFERLDRDADRYETHVLITSDHGESFGEEKSWGHGNHATKAAIHIPCVIVSPKVKPAVVAQTAGSIDVMPTVLSLAGVPFDTPGGRNLSVISEVPTQAFGMRKFGNRPIRKINLDGKMDVIHDDEFYVVDSNGRQIRGNSKKIFSGLGDDDPSARKQEVQQLFAHFEDTLMDRNAVELQDEETIRTLKSLGYVR